MSKVVEGVGDFLGNIVDEVGEFGERLGFGEDFGRFIAIAGIAVGGYMGGEALGFWGESAVAAPVAESGSVLAGEGAVMGGGEALAGEALATDAAIASGVPLEGAAAAVPEVATAAIPEAAAGSTGMLTEGGRMAVNMPAAASPEMLAADQMSLATGGTGLGPAAPAAAEGGFLSNPMVQFGLVNTAGQMIGGYAAGEAEQERLDQEREQYESVGSYGVTHGGARGTTAGTAGDRLAGITGRILNAPPVNSQTNTTGMLS